MGFANDIIGGASKLIRAAIQSPNFVHNLTGWSINKDGTAEFNNLKIRGTFDGTNYEINTDGAFFYSGTPALGDLIASISASSGNDQFTNPYQTNIVTYAPDGSFGQLTNGGLIVSPNGIAPGLHAAIFSIPGSGASGAPSLGINSPSNRNEVADNSQALIVLQGESQDGTKIAQVFITAAQTGTTGPGFVTTALLEVSGTIAADLIVAIIGGAAETWHSLGSPSATGYTSNHGRYRMTPDGEVEFDIKLTGTSGSGTAGLYTYSNSLPAAYVPASGISPRRCTMSPNSAGGNTLSVWNSGTVTINVPATTEIHCNYRMPLD